MSTPEEQHHHRLARGPARVAWFLVGLLSVALGGIGVIVPGLPTTGFMVLAAACFARSSPRFERWVLDLPKVGPMVGDYRAGLGMPRRSKMWASGMIAGVSLLSIGFAVDNLTFRSVIAIAALVGVWFVTFRVPTREHVLESRGGSEVA